MKKLEIIVETLEDALAAGDADLFYDEKGLPK